jgi:hypothetical protein
MKNSPFVDTFDLDITLRDASLDPELEPTRRALANLTLGMEVNDAYYSTRELREAVEWVHEGTAGGKKKLTDILGNKGADDYQRALFYAVAGRGVVQVLDDLTWLELLLYARGRIAGEASRAKVHLKPLRDPYIAKQADGPVGQFDAGFVEGPSWWSYCAVTAPPPEQ